MFEQSRRRLPDAPSPTSSGAESAAAAQPGCLGATATTGHISAPRASVAHASGVLLRDSGEDARSLFATLADDDSAVTLRHVQGQLRASRHASSAESASTSGTARGTHTSGKHDGVARSLDDTVMSSTHVAKRRSALGHAAREAKDARDHARRMQARVYQQRVNQSAEKKRLEGDVAAHRALVSRLQDLLARHENMGDRVRSMREEVTAEMAELRTQEEEIKSVAGAFSSRPKSRVASSQAGAVGEGKGVGGRDAAHGRTRAAGGARRKQAMSDETLLAATEEHEEQRERFLAYQTELTLMQHRQYSQILEKQRAGARAVGSDATAVVAAAESPLANVDSKALARVRDELLDKPEAPATAVDGGDGYDEVEFFKQSGAGGRLWGDDPAHDKLSSIDLAVLQTETVRLRGLLNAAHDAADMARGEVTLARTEAAVAEDMVTAAARQNASLRVDMKAAEAQNSNFADQISARLDALSVLLARGGVAVPPHPDDASTAGTKSLTMRVAPRMRSTLYAMSVLVKRTLAAVSVQRVARGRIGRQDAARRRGAAHRICAGARGMQARRMIAQWNASATVIQGVARGALTRWTLRGWNRAACTVQSSYRGMRGRGVARQRSTAVRRVQAGARGWQARQLCIVRTAAVVTLQSAMRMWLARLSRRRLIWALKREVAHLMGAALWARSLVDLARKQAAAVVLQRIWRGALARIWAARPPRYLPGRRAHSRQRVHRQRIVRHAHTVGADIIQLCIDRRVAAVKVTSVCRGHQGRQLATTLAYQRFLDSIQYIAKWHAGIAVDTVLATFDRKIRRVRRDMARGIVGSAVAVAKKRVAAAVHSTSLIQACIRGAAMRARYSLLRMRARASERADDLLAAATVDADRHEWRVAVTRLTEAAVLMNMLGSRRGRCATAIIMARCYLGLGNAQTAVRKAAVAERLATALRDDTSLAKALALKGRAQHLCGEPRQGLSSLKAAASLARSIGDLQTLCEAQAWTGSAYAAVREAGKALLNHNAALATAAAQGDPHVLCHAHAAIGASFVELKQPARAVPHHRIQLQVARVHGASDPKLEVRALLDLAHAHKLAGSIVEDTVSVSAASVDTDPTPESIAPGLEGAVELEEAALALSERIRHSAPVLEALSLEALAETYKSIGDHEAKAAAIAERAARVRGLLAQRAAEVRAAAKIQAAGRGFLARSKAVSDARAQGRRSSTSRRGSTRAFRR